MDWKYACVFVALAGCAAPETEVHSALRPYADPVVATDAKQLGSYLSPAQSGPYSAILDAKYQDMRFGFDNNFRTLKISRLGNLQSLLPQLQPGARATAGGGVEVNLRLEQVIFDGGVYRAKHASDDHAAILRQILHLRDLNGKASEELSVFLSYQQNTETHALLTRLSSYFDDLLHLADTRVKGGIGAASEVSLFQLKLSEIETDARIAEADAAADLASLAVDVVGIQADEFQFHDTHLPLAILEAIANRDLKESELKLAKSEAVPQVVLEGSAGFDVLTGLPTTNAGVSVDSSPIAIGGNVGVKYAKQELAMADYELRTAIKEAERETRRIKARITALQDQLVQTENLAKQAKARFYGFSDQFRAGSASISEAAGLLETMRQSQETQVRLKYQILDYQRQLAEQGGHFWHIGQ